MKILAIGQLSGGDIAPHTEDEQRVAAELRRVGFILESFRRRDRTGAILLVNADDADDAAQRLAALPFVERDLITFELVELVD
jgi:muconolactone delta-isomerase